MQQNISSYSSEWASPLPPERSAIESSESVGGRQRVRRHRSAHHHTRHPIEHHGASHAPESEHRADHHSRHSAEHLGASHAPEREHHAEASPVVEARAATLGHQKDWHHLRRKKQGIGIVHQEVERLKLKNVELCEELAAAKVVTFGLNGELQLAHERYDELEKLAQHGVVTGSIATAVSENDDLRKQLSAYAVEIHVLREERQALEERLSDAEGTVRELSAERDKLLSSSGRALIELQEAGTGHRQNATLLKAQLKEKDRKLREITDLVEPLHDKLTELQNAYVHQTREFGTFVASVRSLQQDAELCNEECRYELLHHQRSTMALNMHLADAKEGHTHGVHLARRQLEGKDEIVLESSASLANSLKPKRIARSQELAILEQLLQKNIAKEMWQAIKGVVLQKVQDRTHNRESRMVALSERENMLRWSKSHGSRIRKSLTPDSSLDLYEVLRIDFGSMARASVLFNDVHPWHCFSLHTIRRSYDFICPDDDSVRAFVLSISRCCAWAGGAFRTRRAFECQKGWCKVTEYCVRERKTLRRAMLDALRTAAGHLRPLGGAVEADRRSPVVSPSRSIPDSGVGAFDAWAY